MNDIEKLKQAGFSQDEINEYALRQNKTVKNPFDIDSNNPKFNEVQKLIDAGFGDEEIGAYLKGSKPTVAQTPPQPTPSGLSTWNKLRIATGSGLVNALRGIEQLSLKMPDIAGGIPENYRQKRLRELSELVDENRRIMSPLKQENPFLVGSGEFVGEALPLAPLPGGVGGGLLKRTLTGIGAGMGAGALQPTGTKDSTLLNMILGGMGGGVMPLAMAPGSKLVNAVIGKSPKTTIDTLGKKYGIKTSLGEATDNPITKRAETWLEQIPIVGIKGFREKQEQQVQKAVTEHFTKYVIDPSNTNTAAMKEANDVFIKAMYEKVKASGQKLPDAAALKTKEVTSELLKRFPDTFQSIQDKKIKTILTDISGDVSKNQIEIVKKAGSGTIPFMAKPERATGSGGYYIREAQNRIYGGNNPQWFKTQEEAQKVADAINKRALGKVSQETTEAVKVPKKFSFDELWELRKGVGREIRNAKTDTGKEELKRLYSAISDDMDEQLSKGNSTELKDFKAANEAFQRYKVKFDVLRQAYDKAAGTIGAGEEFSPKIYSTALKNLAKNPDYKKYVHWSQGEIDEMTGLASILQVVKRASQSKENVPTGNRWGLLSTVTGVGTGGVIAGGFPGFVTAMGLTGSSAIITKFLTTTATGKALARSASKIEPNSPQMRHLMDTIYRYAVKTPGILSDDMGGNK